MSDYAEIVELIRSFACNDYPGCEECNLFLMGHNCRSAIERRAANAIEELLGVVCDFCTICPEGRRHPKSCELIKSCLPVTSQAEANPDAAGMRRPAITPQEFKAKMETLYEVNCHDPEDFHIMADKLMMQVLADLGYADGVTFFDQKEKWYA